MVDLSIILPAFLEEENLKVLLPKIEKNLNELNINYEVIIVDSNNRLDNTWSLCIQKDNLIYKNREGKNNTYGDAIRTGIKYSRGKKTLIMDADGSHSPEFIKNLYSHSKNYDVIIASRYVIGGDTDNSRFLTLLSIILNKTYSYTLGIKCKDISNSFKIYNTYQIKELDLSCDNFDIIEEMLYKLVKKFNISIKEIPYFFRQRMYGKTKRNLFVFALTFFYTLVKLRFFR